MNAPGAQWLTDEEAMKFCAEVLESPTADVSVYRVALTWAMNRLDSLLVGKPKNAMFCDHPAEYERLDSKPQGDRRTCLKCGRISSLPKGTDTQISPQDDS